MIFEEFLEKANLVHGNKYFYEDFVYVSQKQKAIITCKLHGNFLMTPCLHLKNHGCKQCGYIKNGLNSRSNTENFIKKAKAIHGDKYSYKKSIYIRSIDKLFFVQMKV